MCRPCADIVCRRRSAAFERSQRPQVRVGQVADVNVVPKTGAVGSRVILAKDLQRRSAIGRTNS